MLKRKKVKPITLRDVTIIDDGKLRKAITAASLGNAMEWFDFGVYGFVAYALGKVFFPGADPSLQMIAALGTFSVPFLIRPLGGLFFGRLGDKYGRQKILAITIVIMSISTFCIGLIPSYATIGIWAPILLLLCKMAQGFSVGGEYTGASIFVAEYSPDRKRGFMGSWLDFGSIAGFVLGAGVVVLISTVIGEENFLEWGWRIPFFMALPLGVIGLYLRHALEETPAFQQHVEKLEQGDREGLQEGPKVSFIEIATKHWRSLLTCIGLVISTNVTYYMLLTYMPSYLSHNLHYSEDHGVLIIIAIMVGMLFVQPIMGLLSDRFGRRPFIILGSVALFALAIPAFILINSNVLGLIFAGLLMLAVILNYGLTRTQWGRMVHAVGGNREAARRAGIKVRSIYASVYVLCASLPAFSGVMASARLASASQQAGTGDVNLNAIAAAVIGGTSLFGGRGSAYSALLGIIVIQSISSGLTLLDLSSSLRYMITGAVLAIAVIVDSLARQSRVSHGRA